MGWLMLLGSFGKKVVFNKYTWVVMGVVGWSAACMFYGRSCANNQIIKEVVKVQKEYIKQKSAIDQKYRGNKFTDECILSGCVPEGARGQNACKGCK